MMRWSLCLVALLLVAGTDVVAQSHATPAKPAPKADAHAAPAKPAPKADTHAAPAKPAPKADAHAAPAKPAPKADAQAAPAKPAPKADAHAAPAKAAPKADAHAAPARTAVKPGVPAPAPAPAPAAPKPAAKDPAELARIARAVAAAVEADPQTARAAMAARAAARAQSMDEDGAGLDTGAPEAMPLRARLAPRRPPMRRIPLRWPATDERWEVPWPTAATGRMQIAWPEVAPLPLESRRALDISRLSRALPGPTFIVSPLAPGRAFTVVRASDRSVAVTESH